MIFYIDEQVIELREFVYECPVVARHGLGPERGRDRAAGGGGSAEVAQVGAAFLNHDLKTIDNEISNLNSMY